MKTVFFASLKISHEFLRIEGTSKKLNEKEKDPKLSLVSAEKLQHDWISRYF